MRCINVQCFTLHFRWPGDAFRLYYRARWLSSAHAAQRPHMGKVVEPPGGVHVMFLFKYTNAVYTFYFVLYTKLISIPHMVFRCGVYVLLWSYREIFRYRIWCSNNKCGVYVLLGFYMK